MSRFFPYQFLAVFVVMLSSMAHGQLTSESPFVHSPKFQVVDPFKSQFSPASIRFVQLLVLQNPSRLLATYETSNQHIGVMVFDATNFELLLNARSYFQAHGANWRWGAATVNQAGHVSLIANPVEQGDPRRSLLAQWNPRDKVNWHVQELPFNDRIAALASSKDSRHLFALTDPGNAFVSINLDDMKVQRVTEIFDFVPYQYPAGKCLFTAQNGHVWGSYKGRLFSYDPNAEFFAYLGMLPCQFGHLSETWLSTMSQGTSSSSFLVGGVSDAGYLFTVDPETHQVVSRGRPTDGTEIRSVVVDHHNVVWGIASTRHQSSRLFRMDPVTGDLRDLGICYGKLKQGKQVWDWQAYELGPMAVLPDGRVVMAETSLQAKLLVFDPREYKQ